MSSNDKDGCDFETACSLETLEKGRWFVVDGVELAGEIGKRLADMGFTRGARGRVVRKALLGDPIQIEIRDYQVSIRKSEARGVRVRPLAAEGATTEGTGTAGVRASEASGASTTTTPAPVTSTESSGSGATSTQGVRAKGGKE